MLRYFTGAALFMPEIVAPFLPVLKRLRSLTSPEAIEHAVEEKQKPIRKMETASE